MASSSDSDFALIKVLAAVLSALVFIYLTNIFAGTPAWLITLLFDMDRENGIPAWFSTFLWMLCSLAAWEISGSQTQNLKKRAWQGISAVFLFFSADETAMIHERLSQTVNHFMPLMPVHNIVWPITLFPLLLVLIAGALWAAQQIFEPNQPSHVKIAAGLGVFFFGAVGIEMLLIFWHSPFFQRWEFAFVCLEETCEMLGTILVLSGLLDEKSRLKPAAEVTSQEVLQ